MANNKAILMCAVFALTSFSLKLHAEDALDIILAEDNAFKEEVTTDQEPKVPVESEAPAPQADAATPASPDVTVTPSDSAAPAAESSMPKSVPSREEVQAQAIEKVKAAVNAPVKATDKKSQKKAMKTKTEKRAVASVPTPKAGKKNGRTPASIQKYGFLTTTKSCSMKMAMKDSSAEVIAVKSGHKVWVQRESAQWFKGFHHKGTGYLSQTCFE